MKEYIFLTLKAATMVLSIAVGNYYIAKLIGNYLKEMGVTFNKNMEGKLRCLTNYVLLLALSLFFVLSWVLSLSTH